MAARVSTPGARRSGFACRSSGAATCRTSWPAMAVARLFDVPLDAMAERAASLRPAAHRGEVSRLAGGVTVVDDSYNSNPRALQGALAVVAGERRFTRRRRGARRDARARRAVRRAARGVRPGRGGARGSRCSSPSAARRRARWRAPPSRRGCRVAQVRHADASDEAADIAAREVRAGDLVLVKGSRGVATERVVERLVSVFQARVVESRRAGRAKAETGCESHGATSRFPASASSSSAAPAAASPLRACSPGAGPA